MVTHRCPAIRGPFGGVITQTGSIHARAWKQLFGEFLARQIAEAGGALAPFDPEMDYRRYVDGKARIAGLLSFLAARGIAIPMEHQGLGQNRKRLMA
jgi:beta-phosphoglucomutase-like phosphatase (HAD superfamily)